MQDFAMSVETFKVNLTKMTEPSLQRGFRNLPHAMDEAKGFIKHKKSKLKKFQNFKWVNVMKISKDKEVAI